MRKEVIGNCTLYLADCLSVLPDVGDVDAVVTDPPYGIDFDCSKERKGKTTLPGGEATNRNRRWKKIIGDDKPFDPSPLLNLGSGTVILWGANHYADKLPFSKDPTTWLVWDKKLDTTPDNFSDCELAWSNIPGVVKKYSHLWRGMCRAGKENVSNGPKLHPFQKPEALMSWCLSLCKLQKNQIVLDPYMGSGTTGVACIKHGLKFIGIEEDPEHFETALLRIRRESRQYRLC